MWPKWQLQRTKSDKSRKGSRGDVVGSPGKEGRRNSASASASMTLETDGHTNQSHSGNGLSLGSTTQAARDNYTPKSRSGASEQVWKQERVEPIQLPMELFSEIALFLEDPYDKLCLGLMVGVIHVVLLISSILSKFHSPNPSTTKSSPSSTPPSNSNPPNHVSIASNTSWLVHI
jgi:hypothetical protein